MSPRVVAYSALYGGYDRPKPIDLGGVRCVMYTDDPGFNAPGWEVRHFPNKCGWANTNLAAKWWKTHPVLAVPDADITLWLDASLTPLPGYVDRCLEALGDDDWAMMPHPWRDCVYDEAEECIAIPKYDPAALRAQAAFYRDQIGHPEHWGLVATGANARRHSEAIHEWGHHWWYECRLRSHQDQVSLPVLMRLAEGKFRWNTQIPWAQWWGFTDHGA